MQICYKGDFITSKVIGQLFFTEIKLNAVFGIFKAVIEFVCFLCEYSFFVKNFI